MRTLSSTRSGRYQISCSLTSTTLQPACSSRANRSASRAAVTGWSGRDRSAPRRRPSSVGRRSRPARSSHRRRRGRPGARMAASPALRGSYSNRRSRLLSGRAGSRRTSRRVSSAKERVPGAPPRRGSCERAAWSASQPEQPSTPRSSQRPGRAVGMQHVRQDPEACASGVVTGMSVDRGHVIVARVARCCARRPGGPSPMWTPGREHVHRLESEARESPERRCGLRATAPPVTSSAAAIARWSTCPADPLIRSTRRETRSTLRSGSAWTEAAGVYPSSASLRRDSPLRAAARANRGGRRDRSWPRSATQPV